MELSASLILYIFCILIYKVYLQILHIFKAVTVLCMHKMAGDLKIFQSPSLKKYLRAILIYTVVKKYKVH